MRPCVLDTNVYIRAAREEAAARELEAFTIAAAPWLWLHSVVALELLAGAIAPGLERRTRRALIEPFERRGRVVTPSHEAWTRAGAALARLVRTGKRSAGAGITRSFLNDCLIAASAREHGFVLVTENAADFETLSEVLPVEISAPWPGLW